jgi:PAS domain-containing protein
MGQALRQHDLVRFLTREGDLVWFACHREILRQNDQAHVVLGVMHDVTELKQANAIVGQRGRLLGSLVSLLNGMMWRAEPDGTVTFDVGWCEFTGTTLADNRGDGWLNSIHPDDQLGAISAWRQAASTNSLYSTSYRLRGADGLYRRFEARAAPLAIEGSPANEWVGYCAPSRAADEAGEASTPGDLQPRPTSKECRAARALLGWTAQDLVQASGVSAATITRFENQSLSDTAEGPSIRPVSRHDLAAAFEKAGIIFGDMSKACANLSLV